MAGGGGAAAAKAGEPTQSPSGKYPQRLETQRRHSRRLSPLVTSHPSHEMHESRPRGPRRVPEPRAHHDQHRHPVRGRLGRLRRRASHRHAPEGGRRRRVRPQRQVDSRRPAVTTLSPQELQGADLRPPREEGAKVGHDDLKQATDGLWRDHRHVV